MKHGSFHWIATHGMPRIGLPHDVGPTGICNECELIAVTPDAHWRMYPHDRVEETRQDLYQLFHKVSPP